MKTEALFLFLILLIGLILASFLGTNEGYSNLYNYVSGNNDGSYNDVSYNDVSYNDISSNIGYVNNSSNNTYSTSSTNYD